MKPRYAVPGVLGIVGGVAWIAIASFMPAWGSPGTAQYERYEAAAQLWIFTFALMACGFLGLTARYRFGATLLGKAGATIVVIGFIAMMAGNFAEFRIFSDLPYDPDNARTAAWLVLLAGLFTALIGVFMLGVEALRSGRLPQRAGVGLVSALPAMIPAFAWEPLFPWPLGLAAVLAGGLAVWPVSGQKALSTKDPQPRSTWKP
ncbi:hypothetical protein [Pseudarthrobacter sp. PvP090]|uniref:hypothetical protein n=1 Tax=Pseudarthrobacter sp. PvP090 TaxID=3156393 RepID=UPI003395E7C1